MWKLKALFWVSVYVIPPSLGFLMDGYCGLRRILWLWPLGLGLLMVSLLVSAAAGRTLRLCGHSKPSKRFEPPDVLVTDGVFSCMRHPNQFSMSFIPLALSLIIGTPCGLVLSGWGLACGLAFILAVEEPLVHKTFCPDYCEYAKEVPPISLSLRCIKEAIRTLSGDLTCSRR